MRHGIGKSLRVFIRFFDKAVLNDAAGKQIGRGHAEHAGDIGQP